ncbi:MAG: sigma-54-dependent Fis family transcriptional regulator [Deltaproteobacteria bacterium]|nr:sigma-54-dependent Fis family transcriptional regulator [Deltaproteobacteria bacterium]
MKIPMTPALLIVEDDEVLRKTLSEVFIKRGFKVFSVERGADAIDFVKTRKIDISLLDVRLPDMNGLNVLKSMHEIDEDVIVIVVTAYPEIKTAISAMKAGAYDYINKPFELDELKMLVDKAVETKRLKSLVEILRYQKGDESGYQAIGKSSGFKGIMELVASVAKAPKTSVLIRGETGTGKGVIANAIHSSSSVRKGPFIKINCSSIPDNLLETEMFGYEKGAFTDAKQSKKGLFELADGGTIFLDEIGDMDIRLQPKLLQVLEGQTFRKVGGTRDINVDVRVIAATNKDLETLVKEKKFREDLYYRLKVMVINIPPLRERKEDIIPIAEHFIRMNSRGFGEGIKKLSTQCHNLLLRYSWPGNVRELKNIVERAMILANGDEILPEHLPSELVEPAESSHLYPVLIKEDLQDKDIRMTLKQMEKIHIMHVIKNTNDNKTLASKILGISRLTLREKLKKYAIEN